MDVSIVKMIRQLAIFKRELLTVHREHRISDPDARCIEMTVSDHKMRARTQLTRYQRCMMILLRCSRIILRLHHDSCCSFK